MRLVRGGMVGVVLLAVLAGCAPWNHDLVSDGSRSGTTLHLAQVGMPLPGGPGRLARIVRVSDAPQNANEWNVVDLQPRSNRLQVQWTDGPSPECGEADQLLVQETRHAIIIGTRNTYSGPSVTCTAVGIPRARTVVLRAPIGTRALLEHVPAGVNADYSPVPDADRLPVPASCLRGSAERNVPVGAVRADQELVPFTPTRVLICSLDPRIPQRILAAPKVLADLTNRLNAGRPLELDRNGNPLACPDDRSVFYDLYLSNETAVVQVHVGERGCRAMSNGIRTVSVPASVQRRLAHLTEP